MLQWLPLLRLHFVNYCNRAEETLFVKNKSSKCRAPQTACLQTQPTLQEEYTASFSSFFGRGEERSCAFFTAIRADPPAVPEPSVPPAPGPAGTNPAAPMAGEPCCIPAPSAMTPTEPSQTGPRAGIQSLCRPRYSTGGGSDMALILIFYFCVQARFPPLGGPRQEKPIPPQFARERSQNATKYPRSRIYLHQTPPPTYLNETKSHINTKITASGLPPNTPTVCLQ